MQGEGTFPFRVGVSVGVIRVGSLVLVLDKTVIESREEGIDNVLFLRAHDPSIELHGIAENHCRDTKVEAPVNHVVPTHACR